MSYLRSNIPSKMFYSAHGSEILRTLRATSSKLNFSNNAKKLITRICNQGGTIKIFSPALVKIYGRHFQTFPKFFPTSSDCVQPLTKSWQVRGALAIYNLIVFWDGPFLGSLFVLIYLVTFWTLGCWYYETCLMPPSGRNF